jgi:hypothetical protein
MGPRPAVNLLRFLIRFSHLPFSVHPGLLPKPALRNHNGSVKTQPSPPRLKRFPIRLNTPRRQSGDLSDRDPFSVIGPVDLPHSNHAGACELPARPIRDRWITL